MLLVSWRAVIRGRSLFRGIEGLVLKGIARNRLGYTG
jgi:hypothetical protein